MCYPSHKLGVKWVSFINTITASFFKCKRTFMVGKYFTDVTYNMFPLKNKTSCNSLDYNA